MDQDPHQKIRNIHVVTDYDAPTDVSMDPSFALTLQGLFGNIGEELTIILVISALALTEKTDSLITPQMIRRQDGTAKASYSVLLRTNLIPRSVS